MQITIELPDMLGKELKYFPNLNDLIVNFLSQSLASLRLSQGKNETKNAIEQIKAFRKGNFGL
ncbi:hypothetical protein PN36_18055 [Candidatus Thiomargarita nelsonii]|uniref:Uncharacterized protein n=1 Tax=Candidatus Thiomargarita nelsonii TaxID=1003181 RepID=A0A0A6PKM7_9GAMM|nr:hypothetical protein PN36_18055 [Candidatus Thiomargarita nelsonii]